VLQSFLARYGYLAILALLIPAGVGVPIPEEPTQLAAGVLVERGVLSLLPAIVTCWAGIVGGDFLWFSLAKRVGSGVLERPALRRWLTLERRARVEAHLARHAFLTLFICRHLSGLRLPAFALAATHGVRPRTFLLADGLSACISVPLVVSAGYLGAHQLAQVQGNLRRIEFGLLGAVALVIGAVWVVRRVRRGREARAALRRSP